VAETDTTFEAAALQYIAAGLAGHTFKESVLTRTVTLFGLVGALWHWYSLYAQMPERQVKLTIFNPLILAIFPPFSNCNPQVYRLDYPMWITQPQ
jgi:hypothetical protein